MRNVLITCLTFLSTPLEMHRCAIAGQQKNLPFIRIYSVLQCNTEKTFCSKKVSQEHKVYSMSDHFQIPVMNNWSDFTTALLHYSNTVLAKKETPHRDVCSFTSWTLGLHFVASDSNYFPPCVPIPLNHMINITQSHQHHHQQQQQQQQDWLSSFLLRQEKLQTTLKYLDWINLKACPETISATITTEHRTALSTPAL